MKYKLKQTEELKMKTLKEQLPQVADWTGLERQQNQKCTLIAEKQLRGAVAFIFDFVSENGHPYDSKGQNIVVVEEDFAYIENSYKNLF